MKVNLVENIRKAYIQLLQEEVIRKSAGVVAPIQKQDVVDLGNPEKNIVYKSIRSYVPDYDMTHAHPESNLRKQYVIGLANKLATSDNQEYKDSVFRAYQEKSPGLVGSAKNYDQLVDHTYAAAKKETLDQFNSLPIKTTYHTGEFDYKSSGDMVNDVHKNHHMAVYSGGEPHTHLGKDAGDDLTANEKFRAVHDYYGHALHGNQFGPKGEEIAWNIHQQMYSDLAKPAVTAETRGQNSEVNYTGLNLENISGMKHHRQLAAMASTEEERKSHLAEVRKIGQNWNYARQKASVLPPEMNSPQYDGSVPKSIAHLLIDKEGTKMSASYNTKKDHLGIYRLAKLHNPENANEVVNELAKVHGYSGTIGESIVGNNPTDVIHDEDYAPIHQRQNYSF